MSRTKLLLLIDRIPRFASMLGLLGLIGLAGFIDSELYRFSALSFLSYLAFFRFFRRFLDPDYGPTAVTVPSVLLAALVAAVFPWLLSISPIFGFIGFAGCCGLYDSPHTALRAEAA